MSVFKVLGCKTLVRRCPLFRLSGVPVLWCFKAREAVTELAVRAGSREVVDAIDGVCRQCSNRRRCYDSPNLKEGRHDLERIYMRARRLASGYGPRRKNVEGVRKEGGT